MAIVTATDIRDFLEGFGITTSVMSDAWITNRIDRFIIPSVQRMIRSNLGSVIEKEEYHSGNGKNLLLLNHHPIVELKKIEYVHSAYYTTYAGLGTIEIIRDQNILRSIAYPVEVGGNASVFPKGKNNIKITYTYGYAEEDVPEDLKEAIIYLTADTVLGFLGSKTGGGGSTSIKEFSKNYGNRGKWTELRNDLARQAKQIISPYQLIGSGA